MDNSFGRRMLSSFTLILLDLKDILNLIFERLQKINGKITQFNQEISGS